MIAAAIRVDTSSGVLLCNQLSNQRIYRVGYKPSSWRWTPWSYADHGRFDGRWDDPDGIWRTLYVGASTLACYLEILAPFRPDPMLAADLDDIDDEEGAGAAAVPPGALPYSWCTDRLISSADMAGCFALVGSHESLPTLRRRFLAIAHSAGLVDLDGSAIRAGQPRELTQAISAWIYGLATPSGDALAGVQFDSRHGDGLRLWAIYERDHTSAVPGELNNFVSEEDVTPVDADLLEAMRIHGIVWTLEET
ncbi:Uncharacterized conserved protein [Mycobacteroides abscessus subsp. massiliense]|nr:Uncharacterized conserved protein [Mycobacteroides abscessus subsp. massiliense]